MTDGTVYVVKTDTGLPIAFDLPEEAEEYVATATPKCKIVRRSIVDCPRCDRADFSDVPHFNCIRPGAVGHSADHCTASACF